MLTWSCRVELEAVGMEPVLQIVDHLIVCEVGQWRLLAVGENLPQGHTERPNVALRRPKSLQS